MPSLFCEWRGRWNSPYISHFISADTVVPGYINPQSLNRYSYVLNNPVKLTDPTGHKCVGEEEECEDDNGKPINGASKLSHKSKKKTDNTDLEQLLQQQIEACQQNPLVCLDTGSKDGIYPVKKEFHWGAVDWFDVGINIVGIAGDIALGSTIVGDLAGPEVWLVTEGVEYLGIARDVYKGDNQALGMDTASKAVEIIGDLKHSAILAPGVGFIFNLTNIAQAFQEGYVDVPDYGPYSP